METSLSQRWTTLTPSSREEIRLAALAEIGLDPEQPAAARVAALKDLAPADPIKVSGTGLPDPDEMTLEDIDRELAGMDSTQPKDARLQ